jgi:nitroreductase/dihydropteridine reductase
MSTAFPEAPSSRYQLPIEEVIKLRYTAKVYRPDRKLSDEQVYAVRELLRYAPSSTNAQPWHFVLAASDKAKERIAKSTDIDYSFNSKSIRAASHIVVFCSRLELDEEFLLQLLEQEDRDGRYTEPRFKDRVHEVRKQFIDLHRLELGDLPHWIDKQLYLNVGSFLLGVAAMGIDATPMEGFDSEILDAEFGLKDKGFSSRVVVPIGFHDPDKDFNAPLPKSRLDYDQILTEV